MANDTRGLSTNKIPEGVTKNKSSDSFVVNQKIIKDYNRVMIDSISLLKNNNVEMSKFLNDISENTKKHYDKMNKLEEENEKNNEKINKEKERIVKEYYKFTKEGNDKEIERLKQEAEFIKIKDKILKEERKSIDKQKKVGELELRNKLTSDILKDKLSSKKVSTGDYFRNNNFRTEKNKYIDNQLNFLQDSEEARQNGASKRDIKKQWIDMQMEHNKNMREAFKNDFRENHKALASISDKTGKLLDKQSDTFKSILGPLNIITSPLEEFFGGSLFGALKGAIKGLGEKAMKLGLRFKKVPTTNDMVKLGAEGAGALYIVNKLTEKSENKNSLNLGDKRELLGNVLTSLGKVVSSAGFQNLATTAGIALIVKDAFAGYKLADTWDVKGWEGALGGAIGGSGYGFNNAVKNAIKVGASMAKFGPMGILAGAIIGGVAGFFGGEFWSRRIDNLKDLLGGESIDEIRKKNAEHALGKNYDSMTESEKLVWGKLGDNLNDDEYASFVKNFFKDSGSGKRKDKYNADWVSYINNENFSGLNSSDWATMFNDRFNTLMSRKINENEAMALKNFYSWLVNSEGPNARDYINDKEYMFEFLYSIYNGGEGSKIYNSMNDLAKVGARMLYTDLINQELKHKNKKSVSLDFMWERSNLNATTVEDAIITNNGQVIKTSPKDTLVALKNIPYSMEQARLDNKKSVDGVFGGMNGGSNLEQKLDNVITLLSNILNKEVVQIEMPKTTRSDLDMIIKGELL